MVVSPRRHTRGSARLNTALGPVLHRVAAHQRQRVHLAVMASYHYIVRQTMGHVSSRQHYRGRSDLISEVTLPQQVLLLLVVHLQATHLAVRSTEDHHAPSSGHSGSRGALHSRVCGEAQHLAVRLLTRLERGLASAPGILQSAR